YYDEVFAPVARIEAIILFLAYDLFKDFIVYQMDMKSAFLYGKIEEEVYVFQPPGFEDLDFPDKVYKVKKALYSLHQASRAWYETLSTYLLNNGFKKGQIDKTLFIKRNKGDILLVQVYVDDIIFRSTKKEMCDAFEILMHEKFYMSSMGELTFFLGLQVKQKQYGIFTSQDKYADEILKKFRFSETVVANSTTEAEYVTASSYYGQIDKTLFIKRNKGDILLVQVYVDDIIFGSTKKEMCDAFEILMHKKFQMSSMGELTFFLGLQVKQKQDGIFTSQDKYVAEILKKFGFSEVNTASKPMETSKPLLKDEDRQEVDVHVYRSMIGSFMYLISSRPDIMFVVCVRQQVSPKVSHFQAVKRIFRYLKGQPKLRLWYPKDSPFELDAYTDSDYAGSSLDKKSTTGGCQFLSCRLISYQCKKQTVIANSTTEAEYVAASSCCGQMMKLRGRTNDDEMFGVDDLVGEEVVVETITGIKDSAAPTTGVTKDEITMAQALAALKSVKPKVVVQEQKMSTTITAAATIVTTDVPTLRAKSMDSEAQESSTKRTAKHLEYDISKKQKVDENVELAIDDFKELRKCIEIVPDDGDELLIKATPISSRSPTIINYKIHKEGKKTYFKIIRADGNS
nr:uncharacterized mitochondrial protein AtMg00810-like [Tanacetum cinerariifolium]